MMGGAKSIGVSVIVVILLAVGQPYLWAVTMGTAFTYQGRLTSGGSPASGTFDFRFTLFEDDTGVGQIGEPITRTGIAVSDGYFTTTLDFGEGACDGNKRWLQIEVRPHQQQPPAYTVLAPARTDADAVHALLGYPRHRQLHPQVHGQRHNELASM